MRENLTVNELMQKKTDLEIGLIRYLNQKLSCFVIETGLPIKSVNIVLSQQEIKTNQEAVFVDAIVNLDLDVLDAVAMVRPTENHDIPGQQYMFGGEL